MTFFLTASSPLLSSHSSVLQMNEECLSTQVLGFYYFSVNDLSAEMGVNLSRSFLHNVLGKHFK